MYPLVQASRHGRMAGHVGFLDKEVFTMDLTRPVNVVHEWVAAFAAALNRRDIDEILHLFQPEGFWRDLAAFTWNLYTAEGHDAIGAMLTKCLDAAAPASWTIGQTIESNDG